MLVSGFSVADGYMNSQRRRKWDIEVECVEQACLKPLSEIWIKARMGL
jgi:hypothetical protein